jgi:hypothetical protein
MNLLAVIAVWFCAGLLITGTVAHTMQTLATRASSQDMLMAAQIQLSAQRGFLPAPAERPFRQDFVRPEAVAR